MDKHILMVLVLGHITATRANAQQTVDSARVAQVRTELEHAYEKNADAFMRWDTAGVMSLRARDFHTIGPDGTTRDRAAMEQYTIGLLNGIRKWNETKFTIDSLTLSADTAVVTMSQYLDRMALRPDNQVHRVQTWATQRETWIRSSSGWLLWRVDNVRNQRRLVDGQVQ